MPDWSTRGYAGRTEEAGASTTDSGATAITGGAANVKGSYVELLASSAFDASGIRVYIGVPSSDADFLVDIAVGAADSEQDVISNILSTLRPDMCHTFYLPLFFPASSRISARCQDSAGSQVVEVAVELFGQTLANDAPLHRATTYGAATGDSGGIQVDTGATINTEGAYSEIDASVANNVKVVFIAIGRIANTAILTQDILFDVSVGAASSEQVILSDLPIRTAGAVDCFLPTYHGPFPVSIPAGTRVAARGQSNKNDATDRLFDIVLYGLD